MNTAADTLFPDDHEVPKLTQTLNVLTILTFIGCAIGILFSAATPWLLDFSNRMIVKSMDSPDLTPEKIAELRKAKESIELTQHNIVPLIAIGVAGIILCFIGALMMRKLKKDGYWLYVAGQLVPLIGGIVIMGTAQYSTPSSFFVPLVIIVFIVLYTLQRKYLVH